MARFATAVICSGLLLWTACRKASNQPVVETIDGVEYVHNRAKPVHPELTASFAEEMTIGGERQGPVRLFQPGRFAVDEKGNIYVSDRSDQQIKVFDAQGNFVRAIGAKGQGPGEFQRIGDLAFLPDGRLLVTDWGNRRTSLFHKNGTFLRSWEWSTARFSVYLTTDSSYTVDVRIFGANPEEYVKTFDLAEHELVSFGTFVPAEVEVKRQGNVAFGITVPFAPRSIFAGDTQRHWLYHCLNDKYIIEIYDDRGKLFRKIDRPYQPLPFTSRDKEDFLAAYKDNPNKVFLQMAKEVELPKVKTVASRLVVDDRGNLWVQTNEQKQIEGEEATAYDLFDTTGVYITRIWSGVRPGLFLNGKMYNLSTDRETGLRTIKRYRVVWAEGGS